MRAGIDRHPQRAITLMTTDATCTFQLTGWDETTYLDIGDGAKLTHAKVTQTYAGKIEGTGATEYLMSYTVQGTASFVGMEQITGQVEGRQGSFVIQHSGAFTQGKAVSHWTVVAGSGTGELAELTGSGHYQASHGQPAEVSFDCHFGA
ncbi:DUF3224 domain-containing protein [Frateuria aurantia]